MPDEIVVLAMANIMIVGVVALALRYFFRRFHALWIAVAASVLTTTLVYGVALAFINWRDKPFLDKLRASLFESPAPQALVGSVVVGYSRSPSSKLSSVPLEAAPITPGSSRMQASSMAIAAVSPPESTMSARLTCSI